MLTEIQLFHKRNYKNSIRHSKHRHFDTPSRLHPRSTKVRITLPPVPEKPRNSMFANIKSRLTGMFARRKSA